MNRKTGKLSVPNLILLNQTRKRCTKNKRSISLRRILIQLPNRSKWFGKKIRDHDFYTGCGKEDCHWCNFVKTNNLAVALNEIEEEETEP